MGRKSRDETLLVSLLRHPGSSCCFLSLVLLFVTTVSFLGSLFGVMVAIEGDATWKDIHAKLLRIPGGITALNGGGSGGGGGGGALLFPSGALGGSPLDEDYGDAGGGRGGLSGAGQRSEPKGPTGSQQGAAGGGARPAPYDVDARTRVHWREITERICPNRDRRNCQFIDRSGWTDAAKSMFGELSFTGLGQWSTFKIVSHNGAGVRKTQGGDSWFIKLVEQDKKIK
eukprot:311583-Chlamydomonas_euryale.AAC.6